VRELVLRAKEVERIRRTLERLHSPRLQMMLIVALTGAVGFLSSFVLENDGAGAEGHQRKLIGASSSRRRA